MSAHPTPSVPGLPTYEVYAIRYATRQALRAEHFVGGDPHDGPMPMDYFVWVAKSAHHTFVVDTGFTAAMAEKRRRTFLRCPVASLALVGVQAEQVTDVVLTHLHYDHAGNATQFPNATLHLQEAEIHFACGRHMRHGFMAQPYEPDDVANVVRMNFAGRIAWYNGVAHPFPGVSLHLTGGHTPGMQFVRIHTASGWLVLASDTSHYYENILSGRPFPILADMGDMFDGYAVVRAQASSLAHIIPGHDPLVMSRFPAASDELQGIVARLAP